MNDLDLERLQRLVHDRQIKIDFRSISNLFICPEALKPDYNKPYIIISFDYKIFLDRQIIYEGYLTTTFKQKISLN